MARHRWRAETDPVPQLAVVLNSYQQRGDAMGWHQSLEDAKTAAAVDERPILVILEAPG